MGDKSLESDGVAVASTEPMSIFDEEVIFAKDSNKAYFKYLVGIDQETVDDGTLTGDSGISKIVHEYQCPVDVQKKWVKMASGESTQQSDADTLESNPLSIPRRTLENIPESVFGIVEIDKDFKRVAFPRTVFLEDGKAPPEQAPPADTPPSPSPSSSKTFFGRNKRLVIAILFFFFLTTVGLTIALVFFKVKDPPPTNTNDTEKNPTVEPAASPTSEQQASTTAITNEPTESPTVATTEAPTKTPTEPPTVPPTVSPTTQGPTAPPTTAPTIAPTPEPTTPLPFELEELIAMLSAVSPDKGAALSSRTTNQFFAAQWLSKESSFEWYSDQTKIQRYVLGLLYLGTSGYQWANSTGWLTEQDECNWFFDSRDGVDVCNDFGDLSRLNLPANNLKGSIPAEISLLSDSLGM